jgi:hypothetical protein
MWTGAGPASHRPGPHRSSPPSARAPTNSAARKLPLAAQIALGQAGLRPCRIRARLDGRRRNEVLASRIRVNLAHGWHFPVPAGASPGESPISARLLTTKGAGYPGRARPQLFGSSPRRALATPVAHDHNDVAHNEFASSLRSLPPRPPGALAPTLLPRGALVAPPCHRKACWLALPATARRAGPRSVDRHALAPARLAQGASVAPPGYPRAHGGPACLPQGATCPSGKRKPHVSDAPDQAMLGIDGIRVPPAGDQPCGSGPPLTPLPCVPLVRRTGLPALVKGAGHLALL